MSNSEEADRRCCLRPGCVNYINIRYDDFVLKGARSTVLVSFPRPVGGENVDSIPVRGRDFVPRRLYVMPNDYVKHGFSQGCPGCAWAQIQMGPRRGHSELCRRRLEEELAKDDTDKRADKVKERQDHYVAQKVK